MSAQLDIPTIRLAQSGDKAAMATILARVEPFISKAVRSVDSSEDDSLDMAQAARMAVIEAVSSFDPERPGSLETFLYRRIRGAVYNSSSAYYAGPSIPPAQVSRYWAAINSTSTPQEAREVVKHMDPTTFDAIHHVITGTYAYVEDAEDVDEGANPAYRHQGIAAVPSFAMAETPEDQTVKKLQAEEILSVAKTPRDRLVLEMAFGFVSGEPMSDGEVAESLGLPRSTIQRIRTKAIAHIQETMEVTP